MHRVLRLIAIGIVAVIGGWLYMDTASADESVLEQPILKVADASGEPLGNRQVYENDTLTYFMSYELSEADKSGLGFVFKIPGAVKYDTFRTFDAEGNALYNGSDLSVEDTTNTVTVEFYDAFLASLNPGDELLLEFDADVKEGNFSPNMRTAGMEVMQGENAIMAEDVRINKGTRDSDIMVDRVRIYTNPAEAGLPIIVDISTEDIDEAELMSEDIDISVEADGDNILSYNRPFNEVKGSDGKYSVTNTIPPDGLMTGESREYTVTVKVGDTEIAAVDMKGYASSETEIDTTMANETSDLSPEFTGVMMTEGVPGQAVTEYEERINVSPQVDLIQVSAGQTINVGYGADYTYTISKGDELSGVDGYELHTHPKYDALVDYELVEPTLSFYDESADYTSGDSVRIPLDNEYHTDIHRLEPYENRRVKSNDIMPATFFDRVTKSHLSENQIDGLEVEQLVEVSSRTLPTRLWPEQPGIYSVLYESTQPLGANKTMISVKRDFEIKSFLFYHLNSTTKEHDKILVRPVSQSEMPDAWSAD